MNRLLVVSGEPSGELYAAELVRYLKDLRPGLDVFGLGGDRLQAEGATLLAHVRDLAVVGLFEVLSHLRDIRAVFRRVLAEVDRDPPRAAVLVDYPDFNLRLSRELHRRGIPVVYYVSPQIWAWRRGRIRTIRETVARMLVIFPFEEALYRDAGVPVEFVGHPLVDRAPPASRADFLRGHGVSPEQDVIAVLPGSRPKEIAHNLPGLAGAIGRLRAWRPDLEFLLPLAPAIEPRLLANDLRGLPVRMIAPGGAQDVLAACQVAIVASGTATVEAAIQGAPMVVVYRLSPITHLLGSRLVQVPHVAMANLIAGKRVVPELIQRDFTPERVAHEVRALLEQPERREAMKRDLGEVRRRLGEAGASRRAAEAVARALSVEGQKA